MKSAAIIVAAGRGERAGAAHGPKQYRNIGGEPVLTHTLRNFTNGSVDHIVVVIHPDDQALCQHACALAGIQPHLVIGGRTRQESVLRGLEALVDFAPETVLIHDAARPFAHGVVNKVAEAVSELAGAIPALPIADTLKRGNGAGLVQVTVPRAGLYAAQTPQGFPYQPILSAHRQAAVCEQEFTDDASIAEWAGLPVHLVAGTPENIKITYANDLLVAEAQLDLQDKAIARQNSMIDVRTGNGYDVHKLVPGDHVTLCGVKIAHDMALSGHSDADVGLHALTDALLATCGAGDIGDHFPPTDPQWKGAASHIFVEHAVRLVTEKGGRIANADISLICEAPKIAGHRLEMRQAIARMTGLELERVSVKATTNETIGFVGRREGIAAIATASVIYGEA
ncbi:bifunctional 2-C-methyl-D-erythritol 4-phosphate cytidylyltransferase/2-C-methyl-D-erythritol 2,4-cyclodiphosphate synthase [Aureimonas fodinaquatilis]|uniref:Bifunctional enzyme IspD/IspF n=1 Tax=Aureimonas fodinaquatilis TaxID=2565783 RepID=A0A5B0DWU4_9HYPH|nr:bifunctional 2-C-methyl-D-erythritol 4-phosphate cytidylyltransferase/2-C-methyl-D-erythritol 2,4-cyclodiphosphate synthase [Aureimonas fodinaquatilis]KAA0971214.1 bifunctional 2-C-methyl-D-erythritol 4-phosphate cytidylyltransferase/2-C-methyl-D-erythritol 2,4-cyclodiphosphate synthase [Aureimonas fodinaquatilis]